MYLEKREEEDLPASKTALTHRYNGPKTTQKSAEEDWLQQLKAILITRGSAERKQPENKNAKKSNSMDVSSD